MTSALTIAEVLMLRGHDKLPVERATMVKDFFRQPYISVRGLTRLVAEQAREFVWAHGIAPKDAIHVAICQGAAVSEKDSSVPSQLDKFAELSRVLDCDEDEDRFKELLGKVVKHKQVQDNPDQ